MSYSFIVFCIGLSGGVAAVFTLLLLNWLNNRNKPEQPSVVVYSARYENDLWNVYYEDDTTSEPLRVATFADVRDAAYLLTRVERYAGELERTPGRVDEPAEKIDAFCDARR